MPGRQRGRRHVVPAAAFVPKFGSWSCGSREKPALGILTDRRGAQRTRRRGVGDVRAHMASGTRPRTGRQTPGLDLARIHNSASSEFARGRFLHRGDGLVAAALRAVLHRARHSSRAFRGVQAQSERAVRDAAGAATDLDVDGAPEPSPLPDRDRDQKSGRTAPLEGCEFVECTRHSRQSILQAPVHTCLGETKRRLGRFARPALESLAIERKRLGGHS